MIKGAWLDTEKFKVYKTRIEHQLVNIERIKWDEKIILENALINFHLSRKLFIILSTKNQEQQIELLNKLELDAQSKEPKLSLRMKRYPKKYSTDHQKNLSNFSEELNDLKKIILINPDLNTPKSIIEKYTRAQLFKKWLWHFKPPTWYKVEWGAIKKDENAIIIQDWLGKFAEWEFENLNQFREFLVEELEGNPEHKTSKRKIANTINQDHKLRFYAWYIYDPICWVDKPIKWWHDCTISLEILYKIFERTGKEKGMGLVKNMMDDKTFSEIKINKIIKPNKEEDNRLIIENIINNQILYDKLAPIYRLNIFKILATKTQKEQTELLDYIINSVKNQTEKEINDVFIQEINTLRTVLMHHKLEKWKRAKVIKELFNRAQRTQKWERLSSILPTGYLWKDRKIIVDEKKKFFIGQWLDRMINDEIKNPRQLGVFLAKELDWDPEKENDRYKKVTRRIFHDPNRLRFYAWYINYRPYWINYPIKWNHPALISLNKLWKIFEMRKNEENLKILQEIIEKSERNLEITEIAKPEIINTTEEEFIKPGILKELEKVFKITEELETPQEEEILEELEENLKITKQAEKMLKQAEKVLEQIKKEIVEKKIDRPKALQEYIKIIKDAEWLKEQKNYITARDLYKVAWDLFLLLNPKKDTEDDRARLLPFIQIGIIDTILKKILDKQKEKTLEWWFKKKGRGKARKKAKKLIKITPQKKYKEEDDDDYEWNYSI